MKTKGLGAFVKRESGSPTQGATSEKFNREIDRLTGEHTDANMRARHSTTPEDRAQGEKDQARLKKEISAHYDADDRQRDQPIKSEFPRPMLGARQPFSGTKNAVKLSGHPDDTKQGSVETGAKGGRFVRLPGGGKRYIKS